MLPAGKIPDRNNDRADVEKLTRIRDFEWKMTAGDRIQPAQTGLPSCQDRQVGRGAALTPVDTNDNP